MLSSSIQALFGLEEIQRNFKGMDSLGKVSKVAV
jgi:hypothetical protein